MRRAFRRWWSCVSAVLVVVASSSASVSIARAAIMVALAGPAAMGPDRAGAERVLTVEVDSATLDAEGLRAWILAESMEVLRARDWQPGSGDVLHLRVQGQTFDYRATLEVRRDGEPLAEQPEPVVCQCNSEELLATLRVAVGDAADRLVAAQAEADARAREAEAAALEARAPTPSPSDPEGIDRRYRPGPLGKAGAALIGVGAATVIAGVVMVCVRPQNVGNLDHLERDWHPPGYGALGAGSAVWAGGVTMLVVDAVRCRRSPERCGRVGERRVQQTRWTRR